MLDLFLACCYWTAYTILAIACPTLPIFFIRRSPR